MAYRNKDDERAYQRRWQREQNKRLRAAGICIICRQNKARVDEGKVTCLGCMDYCNKMGKQHRRNVRRFIIEYYGAKCACPSCSETNYKFLTIDHVNNDGGKQMRAFKTEHQYYAAVYKSIKAGNAPTDLRILCYNCNIGRAHNGGVCPHDKPEDDPIEAKWRAVIEEPELVEA